MTRKTLAEVLEGPEVERYLRDLVDDRLDRFYLSRRLIGAVWNINGGLAAQLETDDVVIVTAKNLVGVIVVADTPAEGAIRRWGDDLRDALARVDSRGLAILTLPARPLA